MTPALLFEQPARPLRRTRKARRLAPGADAFEGLIVDLYAGGGGASTGIHRALGRGPDYAINHSEAAIRMHWENHPETIHYQTDIDQTQPLDVTRGGQVLLLWASPQCTDHSRAAGRKPKTLQLREQGWNVVRWARDVKPRFIAVENVTEWQKWGPLHPADHPDEKLRNMPDKAHEGETFQAWVKALRDLGNQVEYRLLVACDFGAPTSRERLFVAVRNDGLPIVWPAPTHGHRDSPEVLSGKLLPFATAADQIDWTIPMCSIFATREEAKAWKKEHGAAGIPQRPLAPATMDRLAEGMLRFVFGKRRPFVVNLSHGVRVNDINEPMTTLTAKPKGGDRCVVAPLVAKAHANGWDRPGSGVWSAGEPAPTNTATEQFAVVAGNLIRTDNQSDGHLRGIMSVEDPLRTITTAGGHALVGAGLVNTRNGEREGQAPRVRDLGEPAPTITAQGSQGAVACAELVAPWMVKHYGGVIGHGVDRPIGTVTAVDHHSLGAAFLKKLHGSARAGVLIDAPAPTVTAGGGRGGGHAAVVTAHVEPAGEPVTVHLTPKARERARKTVAFLTAYYGEGGTSAAADGPAPTITTKARLGLVTVTVVSSDGVTDEELATVVIDGSVWVVVDIAMRMLTPRELARCQGFPESYILTGTKAEQIERIGNSVSPHPAEALIRANLPRYEDDAMAAK